MKRKATIAFDILSRIDELIEINNMNYTELSIKSGIPKSTILSWYRRRSQPTLPDIESICEVFKISLSVFFCEDTDEMDIVAASNINNCREIDKRLSGSRRRIFSIFLGEIYSQLIEKYRINKGF